MMSWFKFRPNVLAPMLTMDDAAFGRRMKEFLINLIANQGAPGTPEREMLDEAKAASEKRAETAKARWAKRSGEEIAEDIGIVYEFAQANGIDDSDAATWYHIQEAKGFNGLGNWPGALKKWVKARHQEDDT